MNRHTCHRLLDLHVVFSRIILWRKRSAALWDICVLGSIDTQNVKCYKKQILYFQGIIIFRYNRHLMLYSAWRNQMCLLCCMDFAQICRANIFSVLTLNPKRPISVSLLRVLCAICGVLDFWHTLEIRWSLQAPSWCGQNLLGHPCGLKKFLRNTL